MKYFIPAWYSEENWWKDQTLPFFYKQKGREFDEMVSLMSMHTENDVNYQTIILNFFPNLRTFMHRHNLFEATYWSVFDDIQGFNHMTPQSADFRDFDWPKDTEFIYTPYLVRCVTGKNSFSKVYFSQDGYVIWIDKYEEQKKISRYIFDDRGFLSSICYFDKDGDAYLQEYLTYEGYCVLKEDLRTKKVKVTERYQQEFNQVTYDNMTAVIYERLSQFVYGMNKKSKIIIASDIRHNQVLSEVLSSFTICFSIFENRNSPLTNKHIASIENGDYWLVDLLDNEKVLKSYQHTNKTNHNILRITPFNSLALPNISNQLSETYIALCIDGLSELFLEQVIELLLKYIKKGENYRLVLLTQQEVQLVPKWLQKRIKDVNNELYTNNLIEDKIDNIFTDEKHTEIVKLKYIPLDNDVIEAISNFRIIIDLKKEPELFIQICSISAGIPQINIRKTDYVKDGANGLVIRKLEDIVTSIDYFLNHLKNWNYSYAYSIKLTEKFASINIINRLNRFLEGDINER